MVKNGVLSEEDKEEALTFMESFEEFYKHIMKDLEEQYGTIAGSPDIVDGDRGIYEHKTHPSAPMRRSIDGRTMKEFVYGNMMESAKTNSASVPAPPPVPPQAREQEPGTPMVGFNPFLAQPSANVSAISNTDLTVAGDNSMLEKAEEFVQMLAEKLSDEDASWAIGRATT
jgi:hypothetical protein